MKLAFYKGTKFNVVEEIIRLRTNSDYAHVELLFSDGRTFSSALPDKGTRFTTGVQVKPPEWTIIDLGPLDEVKILEFCNTNNHKGYDILGCMEIFVDVKTPLRRGVWLCSALSTAALQFAGHFRFLTPHMTSPQDLWIAVSGWSEAKST